MGPVGNCLLITSHISQCVPVYRHSVLAFPSPGIQRKSHSPKVKFSPSFRSACSIAPFGTLRQAKGDSIRTEVKLPPRNPVRLRQESAFIAVRQKYSCGTVVFEQPAEAFFTRDRPSNPTTSLP